VPSTKSKKMRARHSIASPGASTWSWSKRCQVSPGGDTALHWPLACVGRGRRVNEGRRHQIGHPQATSCAPLVSEGGSRLGAVRLQRLDDTRMSAGRREGKRGLRVVVLHVRQRSSV